MKHTRVSLLALSALAGGVFVASAVDMGTNYPLNVIFTDSQTLVSVSGIPTLAANNLETEGDFGVVQTDGAGKINGVEYLTITNLSGAAPFTTAVMIADVTGTVNSSGKPAQSNVKLAVKGNGYCEDFAGTTQAMATISYNFTSVGGISNHTSFVLLPATNVLLITLNANGTTNSSFLYTYSPSTNAGYFYGAYNTLTFEVSSNWSTSTTAGTNVSQTNYFAIYNTGNFTNGAAIYFGTPVFTNIVDTIYVGSNAFNRYVIATNSDTSTVVGISSADLPTLIPTFISINTSTNADTNTFTTTIVYTIGETTNVYSGYTNPPSVQLFIPNLVASNGWQQVDGTVKGTLKAGKTSVSLNGNATMTTENFYTYSTGPVDTNTGATIIFRQRGAVAGNVEIFTVDSLFGQVVEFGKNFWVSDSGDFAYSGKGNLSSKNSGSGTNKTASTSYKASLKGVAWSQGSTVSISGTNGLLNLANNWITNTASYSNIAASPVITQTLTNDAEDYIITVDLGPVTTTNTVSGTNITAVSFWSAPVDPIATSNNVPNAILTVKASGKFSGQTISLTNGWNYGNNY